MALNLRPGINGDTAEALRSNLLQMKKARAAFGWGAELHGRNYQHLPEGHEAHLEDIALRTRALNAMNAFIDEYEAALIAAQKGE